jgi:para-aminobenzoate synthetase component 1
VQGTFAKKPPRASFCNSRFSMHTRFQLIPALGDFSPVELAARASGLPGMVFFDSAGEGDGTSSLSLLAVSPERRLTGNILRVPDCCVLQEAVSELSSDYGSQDDGLPGPVVAGTVGYDGVFEFCVYRRVLAYRHSEEAWYAAGDWWRCLLEPRAGIEPIAGPLLFQSDVEESDFCRWVEKAQNYIRAGDIYQVNLSHRVESGWPGGDPWLFYEALRHYSPAPYCAYLKQATRTVLSSSPELFLRFADRSVRTRPIKGTRPRRANPDADAHSAFELLTSPKEIAELVMITDLERNDLGQCCDWGTVRVSELLKLERFEQVFHLISTVEGRLREGIDQVTALRLCFPGGSITGAPKKRAREIIAELEPVGRGLYTGAAGWFGASGDSAFNILIRTLIVEEGRARFHVGAGIVADSMPEQEWQETWHKAAGILLAADRLATSPPKQRPLIGSCVAYPQRQC